ncbi:MAG: protein rep [Acaryochloris sp. RU_4_1]|nr:protein rep [Acaryochloris sp. RU_4_1]NJR57222.1 protein rep [Acaryochloris sp. CRU_2_0]
MQHTDVPSLSDLSKRDKPWDKHRGNADRVQGYYWSSSEFRDYAQRVSQCSQLLQFNLVPDKAAGELRLKLTNSRFCRVRHCPVCQWRRSLMWKAKAYKVLPKIVEKYPKHRWLFVTLTVKNCPITELRATLQHMNQSFKRMTLRKLWPAEGWLKSVEVTRGRDGLAHPHFHCLLMVKPSYFGTNYMKQDEWVELWRSCARLDYNPILDTRAVKRGKQPMQLIPELLKYCTKESDLVADQEWFLELTRQMHKLRCIATGGILKDYLRELEQEPDDLIHGDEDQERTEVDEGSLWFGWKRLEKKYRMVDH